MLSLLEDDAEAHGLEVVQEVGRENSGRLLAQRPDDLTTVASLGYEFNSYRNIIVFGDTPMHPGLSGIEKTTPASTAVAANRGSTSTRPTGQRSRNCGATGTA
jgi:hypothetical protein